MSQIGITHTFKLADGREITLETGKLAKQADGSVVVKMGDTMLLATVVSNKDAKLKGRSKAPQGANHKKAKLTQEQAEQARLFHGHGWSFTEIGKMFGINGNNISRICKYRGYKESRV